jgi:HSP20 family protein
MRHELDFFKPWANFRGTSFDRVLDDFLSLNPTRNATELTAFSPNCDIHEEKDRYSLELDIPGTRKEDIKVEFKDGLLVISGERKSETEQKDANHYVSERIFGRFSRAFRLGDTVNSDAIQCRYDNGVLKVTVPKSEKTKARQYEIA